MRHLIKKILKEDIFQMDRLRQLEEGDLFIITKVNQNLEDCDPDALSVLNPLIGKVCKVITTDWDVNLYDGMCEEHYGWGAYIMSEDMVGGHDLYEKNGECKKDKCYWVNDYYIDYDIIDDVNTDEFFTQLDEQEEDFGWMDDIIDISIKIGDVFYIVDYNYGYDMQPINYRPNVVRYIFYVTNIFEKGGKLHLNYKYCKPVDVTYNPKDYIKSKCRSTQDEVIEYERALELVDKQYWRFMGNNNMSNNINEQEEDFGWAEESISGDLNLGKYFENSDICFDDEVNVDNNCKITVTKDSFVFKLNYSWWLNKFGEDNWMLDRLIRYGSMGYDSYYVDYELDDEEFNYIYYMINEENRYKLADCLSVLNEDVSENDLKNNLYDVFENFNGILPVEGMASDVVYELSRALEKNRNQQINLEFEDLMSKTVAKFEHVGGWKEDYILIKIPKELVLEALEQNKDENLTDIVKKYSYVFDINWDDFYYGTFDLSGSEDQINDIMADYLDKLIDILNNDDTIQTLNNFTSSLKKLGFKKENNKWYKTIKKDNLDYVFIVSDINGEDMNLILTITVFYDTQTKYKNYKYKISFDELGYYINNYILDI